MSAECGAGPNGFGRRKHSTLNIQRPTSNWGSVPCGALRTLAVTSCLADALRAGTARAPGTKAGREERNYQTNPFWGRPESNSEFMQTKQYQQEMAARMICSGQNRLQKANPFRTHFGMIWNQLSDCLTRIVTWRTPDRLRGGIENPARVDSLVQPEPEEFCGVGRFDVHRVLAICGYDCERGVCP